MCSPPISIKKPIFYLIPSINSFSSLFKSSSYLIPKNKSEPPCVEFKFV